MFNITFNQHKKPFHLSYYTSLYDKIDFFCFPTVFLFAEYQKNMSAVKKNTNLEKLSLNQKNKTYSPSKSILEELYVFIFLILVNFFKICVFFYSTILFLRFCFFSHHSFKDSWEHQLALSCMLEVMFF